MSKDYYKILGVDKHASTDEIKRAFKKLAMDYHPDRPSGDEKKFKEINEAFQVLSNQEKRQKYDQFGSDFEQQGGFGGGASWEDFMRAARGGQGGFGNNSSFDFGGIDLGDIFGDIFGGGGGRSRGSHQARGRDIQVDVEIDLKEAVYGVEREISLRKQSTCDVCGGSGSEPGSKLENCSTCRGQGQVMQQQRTFLGIMQTVVACTSCHGRGKIPNKKCKHCGGDGILAKNNTIKVKIPAGINEGEAIRLTGYGEATPHGGIGGDLYVRVHIRPHKDLRRDGFDIYSECEINFVQAVLGDKVEVETVDGLVTLVIPEGIEAGQLIKIRGRGVTHLGRPNHRGDHFVKINIRVPRKLSRETRKKLLDIKDEL